MTYIDMQRLLQAASVKVGWCTDGEGDMGCGRPHVILFSPEGTAFAHFVLPNPRPDGGGFLQDLNDAAALSWEKLEYRKIKNKDLPRLLRALARGAKAKEQGTSVIFETAADELEKAWNNAARGKDA